MNKYFILFFVCLGLLAPSTGKILATDISLGPDTTKVSVSDTFGVTVYVNTSGTVINSAEGIVSFPNDLLSVESVSMSGSIFSIWVEQPSFSNGAGIVSFNGGSPNPGFNGNRGALIRIIFRAKKIGTANISFNSASVYANDGLGTDVTSARQGSSITISPSSEVKPVTVNTLGAPQITSVSMPDPEQWYSKNQAVFAWNVPRQVSATQILLSSFPNSTPNVTYNPPIGNKEITQLADGISYLHVRFASTNGWGETAHRKIKIDTTPPTDLTATSEVTDDDYIRLVLTSKDKTSGVRSYKVTSNGELLSEISVESNVNSTASLVLPALSRGFHELSVLASDRAGNKTERGISVESPLLKAPKITQFTDTIVKGGRIEVSGTTYLLGDVHVFIQSEGKEAKSYPVKANEAGVFMFKSDGISEVGLTSLWAVASRGGDIMSEPSSRVYIRVNKAFIVRTGLFAIDVLIVLIPLLLLILLLMFTTYYGFHKFRVMRKKLRADLDGTEEESHKIFEVIKNDVKNSINLFKKLNLRRKTSSEEKDILLTLTKDVEEAEKYFEKKIKKIEKEDL